MDSTPHCSRVVPHPSTKQAQTALTSVFGWEPVDYGWYGRIRRNQVRVHVLTISASTVGGKEWWGEWDKNSRFLRSFLLTVVVICVGVVCLSVSVCTVCVFCDRPSTIEHIDHHHWPPTDGSLLLSNSVNLSRGEQRLVGWLCLSCVVGFGTLIRYV